MELANLITELIARTPLPYTDKHVDDIASLILEHDSFKCTDKELLRLWIRQRLNITTKFYLDE